MTLTVETGTFNPAANSYASVAEADARHMNSISADAWDLYDTQQKEQRLITATRLLDTMFDWLGEPIRQDQPLGFPRRNLYDMYGRATVLQRVPVKVKDATIDLALWLSGETTTSTTAAASGDVIEEISLGPIGIKMAVPTAAAAVSVTRPLVPSEIVLALRQFGQYIGGGAAVGRLVR
jgi:hypothetical protein